MNLVVIIALIAVCGARNPVRTYLPPASATTAGGSTIHENNQIQGIVIVDQGIVAVDNGASEPGGTGKGASITSYGSINSSAEAAFFNTRPSAQKTKKIEKGSNGTAESIQIPKSGASNSAYQQQQSQEYISNSQQIQADSENYNYAFQTDNGFSAAQNGVATNGVRAQGGFSYTGDDGQVYTVSYTADENGYQPRGDHLPTPPPIPKAILKSLEQNARDEAAGIFDDGSYDVQRHNAPSNGKPQKGRPQATPNKSVIQSQNQTQELSASSSGGPQNLNTVVAMNQQNQKYKAESEIVQSQDQTQGSSASSELQNSSNVVAINQQYQTNKAESEIVQSQDQTHELSASYFTGSQSAISNRSVVSKPSEYYKNDSVEAVPLGQQDLQNNSFPQQALTSFLQPLSNDVLSQSGLDSTNNQNNSSNGNNSDKGKSSQAGIHNDYLPPTVSSPSQPSYGSQISNIFAALNQQNKKNEADSDNVQSQDQTQRTSASSSGGPQNSKTFLANNQQSQTYKADLGTVHSQDQAQRLSASSVLQNSNTVAAISQQNQINKAAQPATELIPPFETSNDDSSLQSTHGSEMMPPFETSNDDSSLQSTHGSELMPPFETSNDDSSLQSTHGSELMPPFETSNDASSLQSTHGSELMPPFETSNDASSLQSTHGSQSTICPSAPTKQPSFTGQSQDVSSSYYYNQPPKHIGFPQVSRGLGWFLSMPSSQLNKSKCQSSTVNGVTQASISPFPSETPTQASQESSQSQHNKKSQSATSSFAQQPTQSSFRQQSTAIKSVYRRPSRPTSIQNQAPVFGLQSESQDQTSHDKIKQDVSSQKYTGEIYEYRKPAITLPHHSAFVSACCKNKANNKLALKQNQALSAKTKTQKFAGNSEEFGGPRPSPSFDEKTGYHY